MRASGVSLSFHHMSHHPLTLAAGFLFVCFVCFWFLFLLVGFWCLLPVLQVSWDFIIPPRVLDLDDRQGFTARSATQFKKKAKYSTFIFTSLGNNDWCSVGC